MLLCSLVGQNVTVTQIRSDNKLVKRQKSTLIGLGLRGINTTSSLLLSRDVLGMVRKVSHLVDVSTK